MEYNELLKSLEEKLIYLIKRVKKYNKDGYFDEEDLLQEIYVYLWIEWKNGNLESKSESYILKGCYFYLKNLMRKNKSKTFLSLEELIENNIPFEKINRKENQYSIDLVKIYSILDEKEKKVVEFLIDGYTIREIGEFLGISHVMVLKIKKKIKKKIEKLRIEI